MAKNTANKGGIIGKVLAVILVAVVVAYVSVSAALSTWNPVKWKSARQSISAGTDGGDGNKPGNGDGQTPGTIITETESRNMQLTKRIIAPSEYEAYSVSEIADTAYLLNVTVLPETAFDKRVRGAVGFQNPSSDWANGKDVADYVTITKSEINEFQFILTVLQPIGEPVTATVISVNDVNVKCTCRIDYLKALDFTSSTVELNPDIASSDNRRAYVGSKTNTVKISPVYSIGTVAGNIKLTRVTFSPTSQTIQGINSALTSSGVSGSTCSAANSIFAKLTDGTTFTIPVDWFLSYSGTPAAADLQRWTAITNNYLYDNGQSNVTYNCSYNKVTYRVEYSYGDGYSKTYSKTVDNGTYVFNPAGLTRIASVNTITPDKDNITVYPN